MKIAVFGNCQAPGFAACLDAVLPNSTVMVYSKIAPDINEYDVVFVQSTFAEKIGGIDGKKTRYFPSITFTGFHPDCTYIMDNGSVVQAAFGDYHSNLVIACYLQKISPSRVFGLFNRYVFEAIGFMQEYEIALVFLLKNMKAHKFDLTHATQKWKSLTVPFMHTVNHPKIDVLLDLAIMTLQVNDIPGMKPERMPKDNLELRGSFAFHRPIADVLGKSAQPFFRLSEKRAREEKRREISIMEYIALSYAIYDRVDKKVLQGARGVDRIMERLQGIGFR